jgi:hypothetical protein
MSQSEQPGRKEAQTDVIRGVKKPHHKPELRFEAAFKPRALIFGERAPGDDASSTRRILE